MTVNISLKICTGCGAMKPCIDFTKHKLGLHGFRSACKLCTNAGKKAYRAANPDKARAYSAANSGKIKAYNAARRAANPEKTRACEAAYRAANPEKRKAAYAKWAKANPEACRIKGHSYRARKAEAGGKLSKGLSSKLFKLQKGKCPCCKQPLGKDFHMDHIQPLALGGSNNDDNIQLLKAICNNQKHAKHPIDFMQSRGLLL